MATKKETTGELPAMEGKGVAPVSIPAINKLCNRYVKEREKHAEATKTLTEAKHDLIEKIHDHAEEIGEDANGEIVYRYEDHVITLKPGEEKLKVKEIDLAQPEDI